MLFKFNVFTELAELRMAFHFSPTSIRVRFMTFPFSRNNEWRLSRREVF